MIDILYLGGLGVLALGLLVYLMRKRRPRRQPHIECIPYVDAADNRTEFFVRKRDTSV